MFKGRIAPRSEFTTTKRLALLALAAGIGGSLLADPAAAQSAARRRVPRAVDGPNGVYDSDSAASQFVDGLFGGAPLADPLTGAASQALGVPTTKATARAPLTGKLVRNPKQGDGNPPYALIDQYGGVRRFVEPSPKVDLDRYVGKVVTVRRDTGGTLLASQLDLPRSRSLNAPPAPFTRPGSGGVRLAAAEEPMPALEPVPADGSEAGAPVPTAEGEIVEGSPMQMGESFSGPMYDEHGHVISEGPDMGYENNTEPLMLEDGMNFDGCPTCGNTICGGRGCAMGGCGFGSRPIWYLRGEYLLWWFKGMDTPPLVLRGDAVDTIPGNDTAAGTGADATDDTLDPVSIAYGNNKILTSARSGYRISAGYWLDDCGKWAIQGDYFGFGRINDHFSATGSGTTDPNDGIGRPFIDANTGLDVIEEVSFPGGVRGTVTVDSSSTFQSAGVGVRKNLCCASSCEPQCGDCVTCGSGVSGCGGCNGCDAALLGLPCPFFQGGTRHIDVVYGFRWAELNERLSINEDLETFADPNNPQFPQRTPAAIMVNDRFSTTNTFLGGEFGFMWDWQKRRWSLELLSKLAIGNNHQQVTIQGDTTNSTTTPATRPGGLLTQDSAFGGNIGTYSRDVLSIMPQIGATAGYQITDRLRLIGGYTVFYWSRVARPGDQIDLEVNRAYLSDPSSVTNPPFRPQFVFHDSDLWAHGLNVGLDYRW